MHINKRIAIIVLAAALWLTTAAYASAAPAQYKTWPRKSSADVRKTWSIKFNMPLNENSVNDQTIYVVDASGKRIDVKLALSADKTTVKVTPVSPYTIGGQYSIHATTGVASAHGRHLSQQVVMPFIITDHRIITIESAYDPIITNLTVTVSSDVYKVTANGMELHYTGNDTYNCGLVGLKPGDTVTIRAYDESNRLLESAKHSIE
ncbi:Ig-like domain-containing protein [Mahella australiensis]|uniref:SbsA Ig-like domain-containing protein n=1 Tax=Mahella australiensis (strain DSM 15567 / CIP 107919 / 50-1 BON) TaxID=697281 RepID=F3ZWL1_MAHA5|nr:Ig-like domain-containing protein [Mahella australiensis]AEE95446.1 hypothetical protein Mahau_0228 [Mahella australiensis 50-1 BON]